MSQTRISTDLRDEKESRGSRNSPGPEPSLRSLLSDLQVKRTGDPDFADELERIQVEQPALGEGLGGA